jgi:hypothetical protein
MALLDILTTVEATRAALQSDTAGDHGEDIARMNTTVSGRIDKLVGPVVNRTVTEYHDGGVAAIWPRQTPLSTVTTLKEWDGSTLTTLTQDTWGTAGNTDGYLIEQSGSYAHDARIYRRSSGSNTHFVSGHRSIELVYVAGRAATTADVAEQYKECAAEVVRRLWDEYAGAWARGGDPFVDGGAMPGPRKRLESIVANLLGDEMKPPAVA